MPPRTWNTAAYWRELAAHTRSLVDEVKDAPTRAMILRAAAEYDERAEQAEGESQPTPTQPKPRCMLRALVGQLLRSLLILKGASSPVRGRPDHEVFPAGRCQSASTASQATAFEAGIVLPPSRR